MTRRLPSFRSTGLVLASTALVMGATPMRASALNPVKPICGVAGLFSGAAGKACGIAQHSVSAGKQLLGGHVGGAVKTLVGGGGGGGPSTATTALGLAAIGAWVLGGAKAALQGTAAVIGKTTSPELNTTWFSSAYWRIAGIAAVLTLPFLFAAAIQALLRSDLALLARAALGYLPLAMLAVSVAAPLTMLLLAASDQLSAAAAAAAGNGGARFLSMTGATAGALSLVDRSPFLVFLVALFTAAGAIALWLELLAREAAVYVVVLMLPLAFAALVWPARRVWAVRAVELLVALILSKFAIVAVLSLGGAALGHGHTAGVAGMLAGFVLVTLGAFAPWALLRLLPLAELASGAAGSLRGEMRTVRREFDTADGDAGSRSDLVAAMTARMRDQVREMVDATDDRDGAKRTTAQAQHLPQLAQSDGSSAEIAAGAQTRGEGGVRGSADPHQSGAWSGRGGDAARNGVPIGAEDARAGSDERLPGMGPIWQAPDLSWRPLTLGLDEGWPPPPPFPAGDGSENAPGPSAEGDVTAGGPTNGDSADRRRTGDDQDPRPPQQEPEDGLL